MKKNKKAQWFSPLAITILLFTFIISTYMGVVFWQQWKSETQQEGLFNSSTQREMEGSMDTVINMMDFIFLFFFVGLIIGTIISAYFVQSHPVFFFIAIFALVIAVFISTTVSNIHENLTETPEFENMTTTFPIMSSVMDTLPKWIWVVGILIFIALFAKPTYST